MYLLVLHFLYFIPLLLLVDLPSVLMHYENGTPTCEYSMLFGILFICSIVGFISRLLKQMLKLEAGEEKRPNSVLCEFISFVAVHQAEGMHVGRSIKFQLDWG